MKITNNSLRFLTLAGLLTGLLAAASPAEARGRDHNDGRFGRAGQRGPLHHRGGVRSHHRGVGRHAHHRLGRHTQRRFGIRAHRRPRGNRGHHRRPYFAYRSYRYAYTPYRYRNFSYYGYPTFGRNYSIPYDDTSYGAPPKAAANGPVEQASADETLATGTARDRTNGAGWSLLREGKYADAVRAFSNLAAKHPKDGAFKLGFALAAAHTHRERGAWAMRRALRIHPNALHYLELDEKLKYQVHGLVDTYGAALDELERPDEAFMVAALQYLLQDRKAAHKAAVRAARDGDQDQSLTNLNKLIAGLPKVKAPAPAKQAPQRQVTAKGKTS
ncbi:MAG: hypothetical protein O7C98_06575 [Planctomycetota bacterium]|nr:hypothetical protein [Planctomycetota bacterium]